MGPSAAAVAGAASTLGEGLAMAFLVAPLLVSVSFLGAHINAKAEAQEAMQVKIVRDDGAIPTDAGKRGRNSRAITWLRRLQHCNGNIQVVQMPAIV